MAATAGAATQLAATAAAADMRSPIQTVSPYLKVDKRVSHTRHNRLGTVTAIDVTWIYVDWDDAAAVGQESMVAGQQGSKPPPAKRRTAVNASYLVPVPIDMSSDDFIQPGAGDVGKQVFVVAGVYAGKLGTAMVQTGQNWTVNLASGNQVSFPASSLRLKAARGGSRGATKVR